jgi:hypothetical protein
MRLASRWATAPSSCQSHRSNVLLKFRHILDGFA